MKNDVKKIQLELDKVIPFLGGFFCSLCLIRWPIKPMVEWLQGDSPHDSFWGYCCLAIGIALFIGVFKALFTAIFKIQDRLRKWRQA